MAISSKDAATVMAKCARHCCICRRFRPLKLQIHHIIEQQDGGTDDIDNLIAICVSCHSNVHSATKLKRRFTPDELKQHRNNVYDLAQTNILKAKVDISALHAARGTVPASQPEVVEPGYQKIKLTPRAFDVLVAAAMENECIRIHRDPKAGMHIQAGKHFYLLGHKATLPIKYPDFLLELISRSFIKAIGDELHVTDTGATFIDDVLSSTPNFTVLKIKCLECSLHFVICTWDDERHSASTVTCPECKAASGNFLVWKQTMFGFIFNVVPGVGEAVAGTSTEIKCD